MKKKTAKTAGEQRDAFHIYSAGEPADRKGRLAAFLTDLTFLWLYLAGTALWLGAAFRLDMPFWRPSCWQCAAGRGKGGPSD